MYIDETSLEVSANWEHLFRKKHPRISFHKRASDEFLVQHGIHPVKPATRFVGEEYKSMPPKNINGEWFEVLEVI